MRILYNQISSSAKTPSGVSAGTKVILLLLYFVCIFSCRDLSDVDETITYDCNVEECDNGYDTICYYEKHGVNNNIMVAGKLVNKKKDSIWLYFNENKDIIKREGWTYGIKVGGQYTRANKKNESFSFLNFDSKKVFGFDIINGELRNFTGVPFFMIENKNIIRLGHYYENLCYIPSNSFGITYFLKVFLYTTENSYVELFNSSIDSFQYNGEEYQKVNVNYTPTKIGDYTIKYIYEFQYDNNKIRDTLVHRFEVQK